MKLDKKTVLICAGIGCALGAGLLAWRYLGKKKPESKQPAPKKMKPAPQTGGIILTAPAGVEVTLHRGQEDLTPSNTVERSGSVRQVYLDLPESKDAYWFTAGGEGTYQIHKNICYDGAHLTFVNADPGKRRGEGFESKTPHLLSDTAVKALFPTEKSWRRDYPLVYTTPTIASKTKAPHEFTTQGEMEAYLGSLSGRFVRYHLSIAPGGNGFDLPLLVFTHSDISDCARYSDAAEVLRADGKPTLLYMAQIHGNEPAGGDNALAIARTLCGEAGDRLLDKLNVLLLPRMNPDGAYAFIRYNTAQNMDMNRDHIKVQSAEVAALHRVYNAFLPEVVVDAHEYYEVVHKHEGHLKDVLLGVGGGVHTSRHLTDCTSEITNTVIQALNEEGFRATYYPASDGAIRNQLMVNTCNFSSGRGYFSLKGSIYILVESLGMNFGKQAYERRLVSQYITVTALLQAMSQQSERIAEAVRAEREQIVSDGRSFQEDRLFCLRSGSELERCEEVWNPSVDYTTGQYLEKDRRTKCYYYDKAERVRPRATAYVLAADSEKAPKILEMAEKHDIDWYELPAESQVMLRQYGGEMTPGRKEGTRVLAEATLSEERSVCFPNGAYVFPCGQLSGLLLMYLFEPDVDDTASFGSSFCQSGLLEPSDIYRYEHDMPDGTVGVMQIRISL